MLRKINFIFLSLVLPFVLLMFFSDNTWAFPEMVRAGYTNCITCHVAPTGGGILTPYGRALSKEFMSHGSFFFENVQKEESAPAVTESHEEDFLYGLVRPPEWLNLGGDFRFLQLYMNTHTMIVSDYIFMQEDLEFAASASRFVLDATVGKNDNPQPKVFTDNLLSRRHFLITKLWTEADPDKLQLVVGRFYRAYGLNIAEHNIVTRQALGFDQDQETYNAELAWIDENLNAYLTHTFGRPDQPDLKVESGESLQVSVPVGTSNKIGVNAYTGLAQNQPSSARRDLVGNYAILGFTPHFYSLVETDGTYTQAMGWGFVDYFKLAYEVSKGVNFYFTQELQRRTYLDPTQTYQAYGLGLQYFPRTHWEFTGVLSEQKDAFISPYFGFATWGMVHYYF